MVTQAESVGRAKSVASTGVADDPSIASLVATKARFLVPMIAIYMLGYIGLTILAGFAPRLVALKVVGGLNLGFVLIVMNYLLSWGLALIYVRVANRVFDPLVARATVSVAGAGSRR